MNKYDLNEFLQASSATSSNTNNLIVKKKYRFSLFNSSKRIKSKNTVEDKETKPELADTDINSIETNKNCINNGNATKDLKPKKINFFYKLFGTKSK